MAGGFSFEVEVSTLIFTFSSANTTEAAFNNIRRHTAFPLRVAPSRLRLSTTVRKETVSAPSKHAYERTFQYPSYRKHQSQEINAVQVTWRRLIHVAVLKESTCRIGRAQTSTNFQLKFLVENNKFTHFKGVHLTKIEARAPTCAPKK